MFTVTVSSQAAFLQSLPAFASALSSAISAAAGSNLTVVITAAVPAPATRRRLQGASAAVTVATIIRAPSSALQAALVSLLVTKPAATLAASNLTAAVAAAVPAVQSVAVSSATAQTVVQPGSPPAGPPVLSKGGVVAIAVVVAVVGCSLLLLGLWALRPHARRAARYLKPRGPSVSAVMQASSKAACQRILADLGDLDTAGTFADEGELRAETTRLLLEAAASANTAGSSQPPSTEFAAAIAGGRPFSEVLTLAVAGRLLEFSKGFGLRDIPDAFAMAEENEGAYEAMWHKLYHRHCASRLAASLAAPPSETRVYVITPGFVDKPYMILLRRSGFTLKLSFEHTWLAAFDPKSPLFDPAKCLAAMRSEIEVRTASRYGDAIRGRCGDKGFLPVRSMLPPRCA